jgi:uncharacterized protein (DUF1330 family)
MTTLIIVDVTPLDKEMLTTYSAMAGQTLIPFQGECIAKGPMVNLHGDKNFEMKVVLHFPSKEKALAWYNSPAYQEIITIRNQGMKSQFHLIG